MNEIFTPEALRQAMEQLPGKPVVWGDTGLRIGTVISASITPDGLQYELEIDR